MCHILFFLNYSPFFWFFLSFYLFLISPFNPNVSYIIFPKLFPILLIFFELFVKLIFLNFQINPSIINLFVFLISILIFIFCFFFVKLIFFSILSFNQRLNMSWKLSYDFVNFWKKIYFFLSYYDYFFNLIYLLSLIFFYIQRYMLE
jgi:hypothetical protein